MNKTRMTSTDLEFGIAPMPIPNISNNPIIDTYNEDLTIWKLKLCLCLTIIFIGLPMSFCDLYFGYNDNSCVSNPNNNIEVNLYYFLIVSGWINIGMIFTGIIGIVLLNSITTTIMCFIGLLTSLFSFCWNIIGGVIFWSYIDNSTCSHNVFDYVFASLVIKYVFALFGIIMSRNSKD